MTCIYLSILQTQPTGKPKLVQPVLSKIDLDGLRRGLKKFKEHYPERAALFWTDWVDKIDSLRALPEQWEWPLDHILSAEKIKPSAIDRTVPDQLQALQDKETQPTRQVS